MKSFPLAHHASGFHPCAFSSNSFPSLATSCKPYSFFVMFPISFTSSSCLTLSRSPIGTVKSSS